MKYTYDYHMPSCTATAAIFCQDHVLLIKRKEEPFKDCWALPGGFMNIEETLLEACVREVKEETNLDIEPEEFQIHGVSDSPDRDPRGRVLDHLFSVVVSFKDSHSVKAGDDAAEFVWHELGSGSYSSFPPMAFDHESSLRKIISDRNEWTK